VLFKVFACYGVMWLGAGCLYECYAGTVAVYVKRIGSSRVAFCWVSAVMCVTGISGKYNGSGLMCSSAGQQDGVTGQKEWHWFEVFVYVAGLSSDVVWLL